jgi:Xaa-Pro dipeptidase
MCVTIEPGLYFMEEKLKRAFQDPEVAKYLNKEKIDEYRHVGGVRIEDDVYVTKKGCINMTIVPRTIEEIENCMAGKEWRK